MRGLLRLLLIGYLPYLVLVGVVTLAGAVWLLVLASKSATLGLVPAAVVLLVFFLYYLIVLLLTLFHGVPKAWDELRLPKEQLEGLQRLVAEVEQDTKLKAPRDVRLGVDATIRVHETRRGKRVLVIGGQAISAFDREALYGLIAHELAHQEVRDPALARRARRRLATMVALEWQSYLILASFVCPPMWAVLLYHAVFRWAWSHESQQRERAADAVAAKRIGPESMARTLLYLRVAPAIREAVLPGIIETFVSMNEPMTGVFREQARCLGPSAGALWERTLKALLHRGQRLFDEQPPLVERFKTLRVKPRAALALALAHVGGQGKKLIDNWPRVEKELAEMLLAPVRESLDAKLQLGQAVATMAALGARLEGESFSVSASGFDGTFGDGLLDGDFLGL